MKKFWIFTLLAAVALASCTKDPNPGPKPSTDRDSIYVSFRVQTPNPGRVAAATYANDALALLDESRVNKLIVYVFGKGHTPETVLEDPDAGTDQYVLEGIFGVDTTGQASGQNPLNPGYSGSTITINDVKVQVTDADDEMKHFFFVANTDLSVSLHKTTETEMLAMLNQGMPKIDTIYGGNGERQVYSPGIPMSAIDSVDFSNSPAQAPGGGTVQLKRSLARFDVVNETTTYAVIKAQAFTYNKGYVFDTIPTMLQPAGKVWDPNPRDPAASLNTVPMARSYDYAETGHMASGTQVVLGDNLVMPGGLVAAPNPVAMAYMYPTPALTDSTAYVVVTLQKADTVQFFDWTGNITDRDPVANTNYNGNYGRLLYTRPDTWPGDWPDATSGAAMNTAENRKEHDVRIPFTKNSTPVNIARNHVYKMTIVEQGELIVSAGEMVISDWEQGNTGNMPIFISTPDVVKFSGTGVSAVGPADNPNYYQLSGPSVAPGFYQVIITTSAGYQPSLMINGTPKTLPEGISFWNDDSTTMLIGKDGATAATEGAEFMQLSVGDHNDSVAVLANNNQIFWDIDDDAALDTELDQWAMLLKVAPGITAAQAITMLNVTLADGLTTPGEYIIKQGNPTSTLRVVQPSVARANSYLAKADTTIYIPVDQANADGTNRIYTNNTLTAELVWSEVGGLDAANVVESVELVGKGATAMLKVVRGSADGNAVVAVRNMDMGGNIVWSWHIWGTDYDPNDVAGQKTYTSTAGTSTNYVLYGQTNTWMDRHLGSKNATPADLGSMGLLYQWGRKDPFPNKNAWNTAISNNDSVPVYDASGTALAMLSVNKINNTATGQTSNNVEYAIQHPAIYIVGTEAIDPATGAVMNTGSYVRYDWYITQSGLVPLSAQRNDLWGWDGNSANSYPKGVYDPCPAGWRLPIAGAWEGLTTANFPWNGADIGRTHATFGYWPASGRRDGTVGDSRDQSSRGYAWSSSPSESTLVSSASLYITSALIETLPAALRAQGFPVRCVKQ